MSDPETGAPVFTTHEVFNQPPPLADYDVFASDRALVEAVEREGGLWAKDRLSAFGRRLGRAETIDWSFQAERNSPVLQTFDRFGQRRDTVEFHPAYHQLMALAVDAGVHTAPWAEPRAGAHVARGATVHMLCQIEASVQCPITMTYGVVPALRHQADIAAEWLPRLYSRRYDPRFLPAGEKTGALMGMGMTEKQGGSDLRGNTTRAEPEGAGGPGAAYRLVGHKWFLSAPMCDAFLVLAQAPKGPSCFFLPRWTPDGRPNAFHLQRLKSKLGNRSNASSEVEFDGAWARLIGEEGRGVATIIEMVQHTRLDCTIGSAALMRRALVEALHHCRYRHAFGRPLIAQPLMRNVLADLAIESEAATLLTMRVARAFDEGDHSFARLAVAVGKYWVSKRAPAFVGEALECLGGNGFIEESAMPRLYREAPLNSIWEGSGNVIVHDALRTMQKDPESLDRVVAEIRLANDPRLEKFIGGIAKEVPESAGRRTAERLALALQASLLLRFSPPAVAEAFCASRLDEQSGRGFGSLADTLDLGFLS